LSATSPRIALVGVAFGDAKAVCASIESVLSAFPDLVVARMSLPQCTPDCGLLALVVSASTDEIGALAGRLGMIKSVRVKSLVL
jgi:putative iron-only hydrogenase system regulator